jgi:hypothetical protein
MCWTYLTTRAIVPSDIWKTGYTVKFIHPRTNKLSDLRGHVPADCYPLHTILDCSRVAKAIAEVVGFMDRYPDFGFCVFLDKMAADAYKRARYQDIPSERSRSVVAPMFVTVECKWRFANKACMTLHGLCMAAQEMELISICPNKEITNG